MYIVDDFISIFGNTDTSTGTYTYGVYGDADGGSTRNISIYGGSATGTGVNWAGYFEGDINVTGTVSKSADQVKIDHPLYPTNKFLSHSTVTSDQMTNIYHGNVILGSDGRAIVTMPDWFESINSDFRYQLTAIGASAPGLYIATEISNESFEIAGGTPNMKVSWMVTGIRNDNYARKNRLEVETDKDLIERGYYLHPESYGQPKEMGIDHQHEKAMKEQADK
ncbi:MAG: hypothetical protein GQ534_07565 [Candidatus Delongbacteria bacterium]|nr:hypothetical protein [Candidatus Delongbacteria bacterium]